MSEKSAVSNEPNITYFRPDQFIIHVNENLREVGNGDLTNDAQKKINNLVEWANGLAKSKRIGIELSVSVKKVFGFNAVEIPHLPLSIPTQPKDSSTNSDVSYESPPVKAQSSFSLIFVDAKSVKWPEFPTKKKDQQEALNELLDLVFHLDENRGSAPGNPEVEVVSPNWLMSGSPSGPGSTGGPGVRPTPYIGPSNTEEYKFDLLPKIRDESVGGRLGEPNINIVVAILDTAPKARDQALDTIYDKWVENPSSGIKHSLIGTLLGPNGRLKRVYYDDDVDAPITGVEPNGYIQTEDHDYEMTDHGLFVAGIIHSIAPQAELHLFQVLNRYGVGDLLSIVQALQIIQADDKTFPKDQLLVHQSLTINIPLEEAHGKKDKMLKRILDYTADKKRDGEDWPERQGRTIDRICNSLYAQGAKVIAAAGNNREKGKARPQACYPAAFESVLGVGALPKGKKPTNTTTRLKTTSYSNRSDRPEKTGITTLGGEEEDQPGDKKGVLGIYLGEFPSSKNYPQPTPSSNGWGWWGGTSFAAPIITGMTAAVRGFIPGLNTMEDAVVELFKAQLYKTVDDEDVLYVTQMT